MALTATLIILQVGCDYGRDRVAVQSNSGEGTAARAVQVACDTDLTSINAMILHRLRVLR